MIVIAGESSNTGQGKHLMKLCFQREMQRNERKKGVSEAMDEIQE